MIASQASKLPSNLGIRGVCILSLRLVYNFPFQLPGRGNQWVSSHQITFSIVSIPGYCHIVIMSPSLQMLSDHRLAITTLND